MCDVREGLGKLWGSQVVRGHTVASARSGVGDGSMQALCAEAAQAVGTAPTDCCAAVSQTAGLKVRRKQCISRDTCYIGHFGITVGMLL